jgi:hypothetical protein
LSSAISTFTTAIRPRFFVDVTVSRRESFV